MIQFARGTSSVAASSNSILSAGQPFFETDTNKLKIGNGTASYNDLPYIGGSSGKKYAAVVVGTSTAGYTADQVDFLCDGVDDDIEIQAAIDSLVESNNDYGVVVLMDGTYFTSSTININKPGMTLRGQGSITNIRRMGPGTVLSVTEEGVCIDSIYIQGTNGDRGDGYAGVYTTGSDTFITRCEFYGRDIAIKTDASTTTIDRCEIDFSSNGIVSSKLYTTIMNTVLPVSAYGSTVIMNAGMGRIHNCHMSGMADSSYPFISVTGQTGASQQSFELSNCYINVNSDTVLEISNVPRFKIIGNSTAISTWSPSSYWFNISNSDNGVIMGNTLYGSHGSLFVNLVNSDHVILCGNCVQLMAGGKLLNADSSSHLGVVSGNMLYGNGNQSTKFSINGQKWVVVGNVFDSFSSLPSAGSGGQMTGNVANNSVL